MDDKEKPKPPKWVHGQNVAPNNLIKGLNVLKDSVEKVIEEEYKKLAEYQALLANFKKPRQ